MKKITIALALCAITSNPAMANTMKMPATDSFELLDLDQDGVVTATEVATAPALADIFAIADSNGDAKLSKEEYNDYLAKVAKKS